MDGAGVKGSGVNGAAVNCAGVKQSVNGAGVNSCVTRAAAAWAEASETTHRFRAFLNRSKSQHNVNTAVVIQE